MQICSSFSIFCFFNYNQKKDDLFHYVNQLVYDFHIYLVMGYWISKQIFRIKVSLIIIYFDLQEIKSILILY